MGEPIRVLHILQRMEAGGTQALLMNIYRKIDRTKVQFDFLVVYKEKQFYDDEIEKMGGHVYKLSFREDLNLPKFQKDLAVFFAQHHEYKIVHCHAYTIGYFCLKAAKKAGIPVRIAHSHNNETVHDIKYLPKLFMQRMFTQNATDLFACSEEAGKYLFKDKPFQVLKNAIDSQNFIADADTKNEIRKELGLKDKFVVGHVGRLHPQKNHDFLIDVFAEIKKKKPDAELILVGTGPLEEKVKSKVAEKGLSDCVHFLGNRKDMNRIYQAMDVFVFPSLFEGLGTGMRVSEFCGLTLQDLDFQNRRIRVDHQLIRESGGKYYVEKTKTECGRRFIPMTEDVFQSLQNLLANRKRLKNEVIIDGYSGFLLLDKNDHPKVALHIENEMRWAMKKYRKLYPDAPLPHITPHVFRHTFCTNMANAGMDIKALQYVMGHSDASITLNVYTHASYDHAAEQMAKLVDFPGSSDRQERKMSG